MAPWSTRVGRPGPWFSLVAFLLLAAGRAGADDLRGRAALSGLQSSDSIGASSEEFRQQYEIYLQRRFSDTLTYSLSLNFQGENGEAELLGQRARLATRLLRPTAGLDFLDGPWTAGVAYDTTRAWAVDPVTGAWPSRNLQTGRALLEYRSSERFRANISASIYSAHATATSPTTSNHLGTLVDWFPVSPLRIIETNQFLTFESSGGAVKRRSYGPWLDVQYDSLFWKRLNLSFHSGSQYLRSEDQLQSGGAGSVQVDEFPVLAFSGRNEIPTDPPSVPPTQNQSLIDRDFTTSSGVDLGPTGASFWNLSVDMGRVLSLDLFRIHVRDRLGALVPSGGLVSWSVYSSTDGQRWVEVSGSSYAFDPGQSLFSVAFPATSARYFKVVSFGTNLIDTLVTELQVSSLSSLTGSQSRVSESFRQSLSLSVSAKLGERLVLTYQGYLNLNYAGQQGSDVAGYWGRDWSNAVSATLGPFGDFTFTGAASQTSAELAPNSVRDSSAATIQALYEPIPRFNATASATISTDQAGDVRGTSRTAKLESRLRLWDAIRVSAWASFIRQDVSDVVSDFVAGTAQVDVDVSRSVLLRASAQLSQQVSDNPALSPTGLPIPVAQTYGVYYGELKVRSGEVLILTARLGYTDSQFGSGLNQNYRVEWSPFPGGAVQIAMNAEQTIDPLAGREFQRLTLWPRWVINWYAALDLNYNVTVDKLVTGSRRQEQLQLMLTLSF